MSEKTKLSGGPEKTVTWIWLEENQLRVEFYDFSETVQRMFGNDIAYTITVQEMDRLLSRAKQDETSLIGWMEQTFQSYFGVRRWLEENEIRFSVERESWA
jgi:hypothetical protein